MVITDAQLVDAPQLEPAFEHMLRNSSVHESVISILRANAIVDRDTFVNMYDSESSLKEGQLIWVSIWLQAVFLTSASLRAS